jgi:hypothetical protein
MTGGQRRIFSILLAGLLGVAPAAAEPSRDLELAALEPPPPPRASAERCAADGTCIRHSTYVADVCAVIETAARQNRLDPGFFARLIWKESLFDAAAVSPAGAQGIAQFMPGTADLRGLADPFDPVEALFASAHYLADLARDFGNLGLAAAAYNGGEARAERFVAGKAALPPETRAYVQAITGHSADAWRDAPPAQLDLALAEGEFQAACIAQAETRRLREFPSGPPVSPWGVIVASNRDRGGAERQVGRLQNRHAALLASEPVSYTRARRPGMAARLHLAQIGRETRAEADALCARLRRNGGDCMVLRN